MLSGATPARRAAFLTAAYYGAMFAAFGAHLPYWPVWLESWGLDEADIGYFLGAATVARVAGTTLLPALADALAIRRWMIAGTCMATSVLILLHLGAADRSSLLALTLLTAIAMAPSAPLGEALGQRAAGRFGFAYAPVRAVGSITFLAATLGVGWGLERLGADLVVWTIAAFFLVTGVFGLLHPGGGAAAEVQDRAGRRDALRLLATPVFALFAVTAALGQASHAVYYAYSVLDWQADGISTTVIGALWAFGVVAETVLLLGPGRRIMVHIRPAHALGLAGLAGIIRWALMAQSPGLEWLWPLQALHAGTFAIGHLGAMAFVAAAIPDRLNATAQGLKAGIVGGSLHALALVGAAMVVGWIDIAAAYWLAAGMSGASLAGALVLLFLWRGGHILRGSA
ncbi:MAG: MFS transporter [Pseudomonadota bacterium]